MEYLPDLNMWFGVFHNLSEFLCHKSKLQKYGHEVGLYFTPIRQCMKCRLHFSVLSLCVSWSVCEQSVCLSVLCGLYSDQACA